MRRSTVDKIPSDEEGRGRRCGVRSIKVSRREGEMGNMLKKYSVSEKLFYWNAVWDGYEKQRKREENEQEDIAARRIHYTRVKMPTINLLKMKFGILNHDNIWAQQWAMIPCNDHIVFSEL